MPIDSTKEFTPINISVLTISDTRTEVTDKSGQILAKKIKEKGRTCDHSWAALRAGGCATMGTSFSSSLSGCRVLVAGNDGAGKTLLVETAAAGGKLERATTPTNGVNYAVICPPGSTFCLEVHDAGGGESENRGPQQIHGTEH